MEEKKEKRIRRSTEAVKAAKLSALEEKIAKKEQEIAALKEQAEALKRPPKLSERERQSMLKGKIESGALTMEEAYQLGWKG